MLTLGVEARDRVQDLQENAVKQTNAEQHLKMDVLIMGLRHRAPLKICEHCMTDKLNSYLNTIHLSHQ